jgi:hypothetical protein
MLCEKHRTSLKDAFGDLVRFWAIQPDYVQRAMLDVRARTEIQDQDAIQKAIALDSWTGQVTPAAPPSGKRVPGWAGSVS